MAQDKKSFVLYSDLITIVEKLVIKDREQKTNYGGELFLHILKYVNDKEPVPIDFIIEMAFEPIKLQLKRDLQKYEIMKEKRSIAGKKSAEIKQQKLTNSTSVESVEHSATNSTVNDSVTVNVNDNVNDILLEKETKHLSGFGENSLDEIILEKEEKEKKVALKKEKIEPPDLETFSNFAREIYQNELNVDFSPYEFAISAKYDSWSSANWKNGHGKPIKNWKSTLRNTIPHLKPIYGKPNNNHSNNGNSTSFGNSQRSTNGKTSARTLLARRLAAQNESVPNTESGNITIDAEIVK